MFITHNLSLITRGLAACGWAALALVAVVWLPDCAFLAEPGMGVCLGEARGRRTED